LQKPQARQSNPDLWSDDMYNFFVACITSIAKAKANLPFNERYYSETSDAISMEDRRTVMLHVLWMQRHPKDPYENVPGD
jgi:hypothetical protein